MREERIAYYEERMDRADEAIRRAEEIIPLLRELEAYYTGPLWREDYEADEAGQLPANLKRGVLSEDGIDHLLERSRELGERLLHPSEDEDP